MESSKVFFRGSSAWGPYAPVSNQNVKFLVFAKHFIFATCLKQKSVFQIYLNQNQIGDLFLSLKLPLASGKLLVGGTILCFWKLFPGRWYIWVSEKFDLYFSDGWKPPARRWFLVSSRWFSASIRAFLQRSRGCADQCGTKIISAVHLGFGVLGKLRHNGWGWFFFTGKCTRISGNQRKMILFGFGNTWRNGMTSWSVNCTWIPSTFITNGFHACRHQHLWAGLWQKPARWSLCPGLQHDNQGPMEVPGCSSRVRGKHRGLHAGTMFHTINTECGWSG